MGRAFETSLFWFRIAHFRSTGPQRGIYTQRTHTTHTTDTHATHMHTRTISLSHTPHCAIGRQPQHFDGKSEMSPAPTCTSPTGRRSLACSPPVGTEPALRWALSTHQLEGVEGGGTPVLMTAKCPLVKPPPQVDNPSLESIPIMPIPPILTELPFQQGGEMIDRSYGRCFFYCSSDKGWEVVTKVHGNKIQKKRSNV